MYPPGGHGHGPPDSLREGWTGNGPRVNRNIADPYNLNVKHVRLDLRRNFFRIRLIEDWSPIQINERTSKLRKTKSDPYEPRGQMREWTFTYESMTSRSGRSPERP
jgi:hypothetical protein